MEDLRLLMDHWIILVFGIVLSYMIIQLLRKIFSGVDEEMWERSYSREECFILKDR